MINDTAQKLVYLCFSLASKDLAKTPRISTKEPLTIAKYDAEKALESVKLQRLIPIGIAGADSGFFRGRMKGGWYLGVA